MSKEGSIQELFLACTAQYKLSYQEIEQILAQCLTEAWQSLYGYGYEIELITKNNNIELYRVMHGVEEVQNSKTEFKGEGEKRELIDLSLFPYATMRKAIQHLSELLNLRKKHNEYERYKDCVNELFPCYVKSINRDGNIIVSIDGLYDGILLNREISKKNLKDVLQCRLKEVKDSRFHPDQYQLIFERSSNEFIKLLLEKNIPEIQNGSIVILNIARDPGKRTKILLDLNPDIPGAVSLNIVGACLGYNNCRKNIISSELNGEKIHFYAYKTGPDEKSTIRANIFNCFAKIPIIDILFNEQGEVAVVVPNEEVSKCIGQGGSFINLIKKLLNLEIIILSESEYRDNLFRQKEENKNDYIALGFSENDANILSEVQINDLYSLYKYLSKVQDKDTLKKYLYNLEEKQRTKYVSMGGDKSFFNSLEGVVSSAYFTLLEYNVKNFEDLKNYTPQELSQMTHIPAETFVLLFSKE